MAKESQLVKIFLGCYLGQTNNPFPAGVRECHSHWPKAPHSYPSDPLFSRLHDIVQYLSQTTLIFLWMQNGQGLSLNSFWGLWVNFKSFSWRSDAPWPSHALLFLWLSLEDIWNGKLYNLMCVTYCTLLHEFVAVQLISPSCHNPCL